MRSMLFLWQHNPEGVPTTIQQEDDGSLNLFDVDIWMWLKIITPTKGVVIRQRLMQLFGEASQWASLEGEGVSSVEYLHMALKAM